MRIPNTININVLKTYNIRDQQLSKCKQQLQSCNLQKWDHLIPKYLQELCVETIARHWIENPILDEIVLSIDRSYLLDILPTNLPLSLTVEKIEDDVYWKRCYLEKWPKQLPKNVKNVEVFEIVRIPDQRKISSIFSSRSSNSQNGTPEKISGHESGNKSNSIISSRKSSTQFSKRSSILSKISSPISRFSLDLDRKRTWKEYYLEMHVKEYFENLKPEKYEPEKIKELADMCGPYIQVLKINQMQSSENSPNRIPLNAVVTGFRNLTELSICFKQTYVGDMFSWNVLKTSEQDIKLLAKGLEKCKLHILRILNSDVDCEKITMILKSLLRHDKLSILDFSHCKIAYKGCIAIAKFILENPVKTIILANNRIDSRGVTSICYSITQEACNLKSLNLKQNQIFDNGGKTLMEALSAKSCLLKSLVVSGCGFKKNIYIENMLKINDALEFLDVSNNKLGEEVGIDICKALDTNKTLKNIDVRMCNISSETEDKIRDKVNKNRKPSSTDFLKRSKSREDGRILNEDVQQEEIDVKINIDEDIILEIENVFQT